MGTCLSMWNIGIVSLVLHLVSVRGGMVTDY